MYRIHYQDISDNCFFFVFQVNLTTFENDVDDAAAKCDILKSVEMLSGMPQLDGVFQLAPSQVLDHDFISMCHIRDMYERSQQ